MADVHEPDVRSYNMSQIRSRDTKPEIFVRKYLFSKGLRFRLHNRKLPGCPDIVLRKYASCIFVHGCFWHGHSNCRFFQLPKSNRKYWMAKIEGNKSRGTQHIKELKKLGWKVFVIWECDLKKQPYKKLDNIIAKVKR